MDQKLSLSQRGIVHVLAIVIGLGLLAVLAFSLNALFASRRQQQPQTVSEPESRGSTLPTVSVQQTLPIQATTSEVFPTPTVITTQAEPTSGWNEYLNSQYGFSIKYPSRYVEIQNWSDPGSGILFSKTIGPQVDEPLGQGLITVEIRSQLVDDRIKSWEELSGAKAEEFTSEGIGRHAYRIRWETVEGWNNEGGQPLNLSTMHEVILIGHNGLSYEIGASIKSTALDRDEFFQEFRRIINTFRFIN